MRTAFVAAVAAAPGAVPTEVRAILQARQPPVGVAFRAAEHLSWADATDTILVGAWSERSEAGAGSPWRIDPQRLSIVVGHVRRRGTPWLPPNGWPTLLHALFSTSPEPELDELVGVFSGLVVDTDRALAITDAFSHHGLYVARGRAHDIVASNPALAAWAINGEGSPPVRDALGVCGLAYTRHRIGERTGYTGVRSLRTGTYVAMRARSEMKIVDRSPPWEHSPELSDGAKTADALVDIAQEAVQEELEANVGFPAPVLLTDLTGGKDSRLVLAVALISRVASKLVFRTDGPSSVLDVVVAQELAELVGVRWLGRAEHAGFPSQRARRATGPRTRGPARRRRGSIA